MQTNRSTFAGDDRPVDNVVWKECEEFCRRTGLSFPTEAQWEYACRGGQGSPYSGSEVLNDMGWFSGNSRWNSGILASHMSGEKRCNQFGLCDMHGNVAEWCEDVFDPEFYQKETALVPDPVCRTSSSEQLLHVVRGGGWFDVAEDCRSASRRGAGSNWPPGGMKIGFRPVSLLCPGFR